MPFTPPMSAVIVALPAPIAVTRPEAGLTDAIEVSLEVHATRRPPSADGALGRVLGRDVEAALGVDGEAQGARRDADGDDAGGPAPARGG